MSSSVLGGLAPLIELVVPVYNEEADLPRAIERLTTALDELPWTWLITIADNASTDATPAVAQSLADAHPGVRVVTFARKGRGGALKRVWQSSTAQVLAYTDVDLSTDLNALLPLVAPLISGHSDLAIGSRLAAATPTAVARTPSIPLAPRLAWTVSPTPSPPNHSTSRIGIDEATTSCVPAASEPLVSSRATLGSSSASAARQGIARSSASPAAAHASRHPLVQLAGAAPPPVASSASATCVHHCPIGAMIRSLTA